MEFGKGTKAHQVINPKISRGYEHVLEKGWDDQLVKKFQEIDQLKEAMAYGFQRNSYADEELQDLMSHIQDHLDDRFAAGRREVSGESKLRAPDQTATHYSTDAASSPTSMPAQLSQPATLSTSTVDQDHSLQPQLPSTDAGKSAPSADGAAVHDAQPNSPRNAKPVPKGSKRPASTSPATTRASEKSAKRPKLQAKNGTNVHPSSPGDSEGHGTSH